MLLKNIRRILLERDLTMISFAQQMGITRIRVYQLIRSGKVEHIQRLADALGVRVSKLVGHRFGPSVLRRRTNHD